MLTQIPDQWNDPSKIRMKYKHVEILNLIEFIAKDFTKGKKGVLQNEEK